MAVAAGRCAGPALAQGRVSRRTILRADKTAGAIILDSETQLAGIPKEAWDYRLGNRSALDWMLDQHKEKTPKDPTIRENSTPTASPTTRRRWSICWRA